MKKVIYIGKKFVDDIRECCLFDTVTHEKRDFLATEKEVIDAAKAEENEIYEVVHTELFSA